MQYLTRGKTKEEAEEEIRQEAYIIYQLRLALCIDGDDNSDYYSVINRRKHGRNNCMGSS